MSGEHAESRPRRRHPVLRRVLIVLGALALVLVLSVGATAAWYAHKINDAISGVKRSSLMPTGASRSPHQPYLPGKPLTFVLMGSDSRSTSAADGRSDSLMVAYLAGNRKNAYLVSFPRDMYVSIPGHGKAKINAAYSWGGPPLAIQTLESLLGMRMDHAVVIDFEGFITMTDSLGGVTVQNKVASTSGDKKYTWPQGSVTLTTGAEALAYVRQRYELPNGDLDRAERQRAVVTAILDKLISAGTLTNPNRFTATLDQMSACMTVDAELDNATIKKIAGDLKINSGSDIRSLQAPVSGFATTSDGQAIDVVNQKQLAEMAAAMRNDTMETYYQKYKG